MAHAIQERMNAIEDEQIFRQVSYDPRNPELIMQATDEEILQTNVDLKLRQIAQLESYVARSDSRKQPNPNISPLPRSMCGSGSWETSSTRCSSTFPSPTGSIREKSRGVSSDDESTKTPLSYLEEVLQMNSSVDILLFKERTSSDGHTFGAPETKKSPLSSTSESWTLWSWVSTFPPLCSCAGASSHEPVFIEQRRVARNTVWL